MTRPESIRAEPMQLRKAQFVLALHQLYRREPESRAASGFELPEIVEVFCERPNYAPQTHFGRALKGFGYTPAKSARLRRLEMSFLDRTGIATDTIGELVEDGVVQEAQIAWETIEEGYGRQPLENGRLYALTHTPPLADRLLAQLVSPVNPS